MSDDQEYKHASRRHFTRIAFDQDCAWTHRGQDYSSHLIDISLKGALVKKPPQWSGKIGDTFTLDVLLSDEVGITMDIVIAHLEEMAIGLECQSIDAESISHLRRVAELNLGQPELVHRELSALGKEY